MFVTTDLLLNLMHVYCFMNTDTWQCKPDRDTF